MWLTILRILSIAQGTGLLYLGKFDSSSLFNLKIKLFWCELVKIIGIETKVGY